MWEIVKRGLQRERSMAGGLSRRDTVHRLHSEIVDAFLKAGRQAKQRETVSLSENIEERRGIWRAVGLAIAMAIRLLNPYVLITAAFGSHTSVFEHVSARVHCMRAVLSPRTGGRRRRVTAWMQETLPQRHIPDAASSVWEDGSLLCGIVDNAVAGACPGYEALSQTDRSATLWLGQKLVSRYLGVPPVFNDEELMRPFLTVSMERRLLRYLAAVRSAAAQVEAEREKRQSADSSDCIAEESMLECVARGMGLILGAKGRSSTFFLYLNPNHPHRHIHRLMQNSNLRLEKECVEGEAGAILMQIRGPDGDFGAALISTVPNSTSSSRRSSINLTESWCGRIPITYITTQERVKVSYIPLSTGIHELSLLLRGGSHVPGSPFSITVEESLRIPLDVEGGGLYDSRLIDPGLERSWERKRVISRIVDFVTEKMILTEDGKLERMPRIRKSLEKKLREKESEDGERPSHVTNRDYSTSSPTRIIRDDLKSNNPDQETVSVLNVSPLLKKEPVPDKKEGSVENFSKRTLDLFRISDPYFPRKGPIDFRDHCRRILWLCDILLKYTPRQEGLEILNTAGDILGGKRVHPTIMEESEPEDGPSGGNTAIMAQRLQRNRSDSNGLNDLTQWKEPRRSVHTWSRSERGDSGKLKGGSYRGIVVRELNAEAITGAYAGGDDSKEEEGRPMSRKPHFSMKRRAVERSSEKSGVATESLEQSPDAEKQPGMAKISGKNSNKHVTTKNTQPISYRENITATKTVESSGDDANKVTQPSILKCELAKGTASHGNEDSTEITSIKRDLEIKVTTEDGELMNKLSADKSKPDVSNPIPSMNQPQKEETKSGVGGRDTLVEEMEVKLEGKTNEGKEPSVYPTTPEIVKSNKMEEPSATIINTYSEHVDTLVEGKLIDTTTEQTSADEEKVKAEKDMRLEKLIEGGTEKASLGKEVRVKVSDTQEKFSSVTSNPFTEESAELKNPKVQRRPSHLISKMLSFPRESLEWFESEEKVEVELEGTIEKGSMEEPWGDRGFEGDIPTDFTEKQQDEEWPKFTESVKRSGVGVGVVVAGGIVSKEDSSSPVRKRQEWRRRDSERMIEMAKQGSTERHWEAISTGIDAMEDGSIASIITGVVGGERERHWSDSEEAKEDMEGEEEKGTVQSGREEASGVVRKTKWWSLGGEAPLASVGRSEDTSFKYERIERAQEAGEENSKKKRKEGVDGRRKEKSTENKYSPKREGRVVVKSTKGLILGSVREGKRETSLQEMGMEKVDKLLGCLIDIPKDDRMNESGSSPKKVGEDMCGVRMSLEDWGRKGGKETEVIVGEVERGEKCTVFKRVRDAKKDDKKWVIEDDTPLLIMEVASGKRQYNFTVGENIPGDVISSSDEKDKKGGAEIKSKRKSEDDVCKEVSNSTAELQESLTSANLNVDKEELPKTKLSDPIKTEKEAERQKSAGDDDNVEEISRESCESFSDFDYRGSQQNRNNYPDLEELLGSDFSCKTTTYRAQFNLWPSEEAFGEKKVAETLESVLRGKSPMTGVVAGILGKPTHFSRVTTSNSPKEQTNRDDIELVDLDSDEMRNNDESDFIGFDLQSHPKAKSGDAFLIFESPGVTTYFPFEMEEQKEGGWEEVTLYLDEEEDGKITEIKESDDSASDDSSQKNKAPVLPAGRWNNRLSMSPAMSAISEEEAEEALPDKEQSSLDTGGEPARWDEEDTSESDREGADFRKLGPPAKESERNKSILPIEVGERRPSVEGPSADCGAAFVVSSELALTLALGVSITQITPPDVDPPQTEDATVPIVSRKEKAVQTDLIEEEQRGWILIDNEERRGGAIKKECWRAKCEDRRKKESEEGEGPEGVPEERCTNGNEGERASKYYEKRKGDELMVDKILELTFGDGTSPKQRAARLGRRESVFDDYKFDLWEKGFELKRVETQDSTGLEYYLDDVEQLLNIELEATEQEVKYISAKEIMENFTKVVESPEKVSESTSSGEWSKGNTDAKNPWDEEGVSPTNTSQRECKKSIDDLLFGDESAEERRREERNWEEEHALAKKKREQTKRERSAENKSPKLSDRRRSKNMGIFKTFDKSDESLNLDEESEKDGSRRRQSFPKSSSKEMEDVSQPEASGEERENSASTSRDTYPSLTDSSGDFSFQEKMEKITTSDKGNELSESEKVIENIDGSVRRMAISGSDRTGIKLSSNEVGEAGRAGKTGKSKEEEIRSKLASQSSSIDEYRRAVSEAYAFLDDEETTKRTRRESVSWNAAVARMDSWDTEWSVISGAETGRMQETTGLDESSESSLSSAETRKTSDPTESSSTKDTSTEETPDTRSRLKYKKSKDDEALFQASVSSKKDNQSDFSRKASTKHSEGRMNFEQSSSATENSDSKQSSGESSPQEKRVVRQIAPVQRKKESPLIPTKDREKSDQSVSKTTPESSSDSDVAKADDRTVISELSEISLDENFHQDFAVREETAVMESKQKGKTYEKSPRNKRLEKKRPTVVENAEKMLLKANTNNDERKVKVSKNKRETERDGDDEGKTPPTSKNGESISRSSKIFTGNDDSKTLRKDVKSARRECETRRVEERLVSSVRSVADGRTAMKEERKVMSEDEGGFVARRRMYWERRMSLDRTADVTKVRERRASLDAVTLTEERRRIFSARISIPPLREASAERDPVKVSTARSEPKPASGSIPKGVSKIKHKSAPQPLTQSSLKRVTSAKSDITPSKTSDKARVVSRSEMKPTTKSKEVQDKSAAVKKVVKRDKIEEKLITTDSAVTGKTAEKVTSKVKKIKTKKPPSTLKDSSVAVAKSQNVSSMEKKVVKKSTVGAKPMEKTLQETEGNIQKECLDSEEERMEYAVNRKRRSSVEIRVTDDEDVLREITVIPVFQMETYEEEEEEIDLSAVRPSTEGRREGERGDDGRTAISRRAAKGTAPIQKKEPPPSAASSPDSESSEFPRSRRHSMQTPASGGESKKRFSRAKQFFENMGKDSPPSEETPKSKKKKARGTATDVESMGKSSMSKPRRRSPLRNPDSERRRRGSCDLIHSAPGSDVDNPCEKRELRSQTFGGSERQPRVSERFNVMDLFKDVAGAGTGGSGDLSGRATPLGIPHQAAVLAALRSVEDEARSPYDLYEGADDCVPSMQSKREYQSEYPHLPITSPRRSRHRSSHVDLIPRNVLLKSPSKSTPSRTRSQAELF